MKYFLFFLLITLSVIGQEKPTDQELIEKLDRTFLIKEGLTKGRLYIKKGNHESHSWNVSIFKEGEDILYIFTVTHFKPVAKLLSIKRGQKLIYSNVLSGKIFQIEQLQRLENILGTSFSYIDLSNYQYESNYKPFKPENSEKENQEKDRLSIHMIPISHYLYKDIEIDMANTDYSLRKLTFTSPNGIIEKTLKVKYGKIKQIDGKAKSEIIDLKFIEITNNATSEISILEFQEWYKDTKPDKIFYEMKSLYEK
ncbi:MAG TPA: hypothetical protein PK079_04525 [Leptospiraceae bacterium]|nr:hypothetical protein [Leptospiraceae bacterium]HMW04922.1 hypothetical protein [Leptospiraceae bacterium]HMX31929.1 hypothetical protein [Leptospiraceae bacterium]HMY30857.1 hypothetical protein [Leptospiraceae bacterium]HMZ62661.1 hypothetical protein [Leptospiraceae bacterium]